MDYEKLENPTVLDNAEKAIKGCSFGNGFDGLINIIGTFIKDIIIALVSGIILISLDIWLFPIFLIIEIIRAMMLNKTKIQDKKLCWDIMAHFYRKLRYIGQVHSDFSYAKDVRIFNMSDYLKTKHERINDSAHKLFVDHKKRWFSFEIKNHIICRIYNSI